MDQANLAIAAATKQIYTAINLGSSMNGTEIGSYQMDSKGMSYESTCYIDVLLN